MGLMTFYPERDALVEQTRLSRFQPGAGQVFSASASEAIHQTLPVALNNFIRLGGAHELLGVERPSVGLLSKAEYEESEWFRKDIPWRDGLTASMAKILAERRDRRELNEFIIGKGAAEHPIALLAGALVGSIPDPMNFVPFVGPGARALMVARLGRIGGHALTTAIEAGIGAALTEPVLIAQAKLLNEDHDLRMAATNVMLAMGLGAGFGSIGGALARMPDAARIRGTAKAIADLSEGRPVDVSEALVLHRRDVSEAVRAELAEMEGAGTVRAQGVDSDATVPSQGENSARTVIDALGKTPIERTAEESAALDVADLPPVLRDAVRIANTPAAERTAAESALLKAVVDGNEQQFLESAIERTKTDLAEVEKKIEAVQANLKDAQGEEFDQLVRTRILAQAALRSDEARLAELREGRALDFTVVQRERVEAPEVEPDTPAKVGAPADVEPGGAEAMRAQVAALEAQGRLNAADKAELAEARELTTKAEDYSAAYVDAAACLARAA